VSELVDLSVRVVEELRQSLPEGCTARQFLQMVMRGEIDPPPKQINAAKVLIEYEEAKLTAVAMGHFDKTDFASMLERALARSAQVAKPAQPLPALPAPVAPPNHAKPFTRLRRNLR
jgi:hypothetical protein